jgi:hypothetical protein
VNRRPHQPEPALMTASPSLRRLMAQSGLMLVLASSGSLCGQETSAPVPSVSAQRRSAQEASEQQTLSASQLFLISGLDRDQRATLSMTLERWREQFTQLWPDASDAPPLAQPLATTGSLSTIHLIYQTQAPLVPTPRIIQSVETKKLILQLRVSPLTPTENPHFLREIVRLMLIERAQRVPFEGEIQLGDQFPPDWLTEAFFLALQIQSDTSALDPWLQDDSETSHDPAHTLMTPEELFQCEYDDLFPGQRERYRWSAYALLGVLRDLPQSQQWLGQYLRLSATSVAPIANQLKQTFPGFALSERSLEKWWSLHLTEQKKGRFTDALSYDLTEKKLTEALTALLPTPKEEEKKQLPLLTATKKRWRPFSKEKKEPIKFDLRTIEKLSHEKISLQETTIAKLTTDPYRDYWIAQCEPQLTQLQLRAHPLYRPVIDSYLRLLGLMREGKNDATQPFWAQAHAEHRATYDRLRRVTAHLDWYLATQRPEPSGRYDELFDWIQKKTRPTAVLPQSAISRYLDEVELELKEAKKISQPAAPPSAPTSVPRSQPQVRVK